MENLINLQLAVSLFITVQGLLTLFWMLYAWENPENAREKSSPDEYIRPKLKFTALIPMRKEEHVAGDTIEAVNNIDYPQELKEIIVICRYDDQKTIEKVKNKLMDLKNDNIKLMILGDTYPINKPHSLNHGLREASGDMVAIFDAEDEPHPEIYKIINTIIYRNDVDIVQSGVQLMNYDSRWFSALNVLEYYLWFKSGLHFFTDIGKVTFLGGNTVFFKKDYLEKVNGWNENSLTEDADIGLRLSVKGARAKMIYDQRHVTREETPSTVDDFIKQRTRWNTGFLQILFQGDWLKLPSLKQKLISSYILLAPFFPIFLVIYIPIGLFVGLGLKPPVHIALISYLPFYVLIAIIMVQLVAMKEFTKLYAKKFHWYLPLMIVFTFVPYMSILAISSLRAIVKYLARDHSWEKTTHLNVHRLQLKA